MMIRNIVGFLISSVCFHNIYINCIRWSIAIGFWYMQKNFKDVPIGQIIYHLNTPLEGTNTSSFSVIFISIILIIIICVLMVTFGLLIFRKKKNKWIYKFWMSLLGCIAIAYSIILCCFHFDIISYLKDRQSRIQRYMKIIMLMEEM